MGRLYPLFWVRAALIEKISIDASTRSAERQLRVVFVGDYIDRGDQAREVIECLILLKSPRC